MLQVLLKTIRQFRIVINPCLSIFKFPCHGMEIFKLIIKYFNPAIILLTALSVPTREALPLEPVLMALEFAVLVSDQLKKKKIPVSSFFL